MLTPKDLWAWIAGSAPGARLTYYEGDLQYDRAPMGADPTTVTTEQRTLNHLADAAYSAMLDNDILLVQVRLSPNQWKYVAIRRRRPRVRPKYRPGALP